MPAPGAGPPPSPTRGAEPGIELVDRRRSCAATHGGGAPTGAQALAAAAGGAAAGPGGRCAEPEAAPVVQQRHTDANEPGRNDPCWCGSGKKYKKCHGA